MTEEKLVVLNLGTNEIDIIDVDDEVSSYDNVDDYLQKRGYGYDALYAFMYNPKMRSVNNKTKR